MTAVPPPASLLGPVVALAAEAGRATLAFYGNAASRTKADGSPVTEADEAANRIIVAGLRALAPAIPVVTEEDDADNARDRAGSGDHAFWLVDPLDGTREFLNGNGEFTVNIALIVDGGPVLGVVVAPALGETYAGCGPGTATREAGGTTRPIAARFVPADGLVVVGSRSHGDDAALASFLDGRKVAATRVAGSSLKLCMVATGDADLYPRLGTTMEWDIAAGHAVLAAAGGRVETLDSAPLRYGKPDWRNPHFAAWGLRARG